MPPISSKKTTVATVVIDGRALPLLAVLAGSSDLSQREIARRCGFSLTRAHFVIKELIQSGLVQVQNAPARKGRQNYAYELTEAGQRMHSRLAYRALRHTVHRFQDVVERLQIQLTDLIASGVQRIGLLGRGELVQPVLQLIAQEPNLQLVDVECAEAVLVCDLDAAERYRGEARLVHLHDLATGLWA